MSDRFALNLRIVDLLPQDGSSIGNIRLFGFLTKEFPGIEQQEYEMARSAQIYLKDNFLDQNKYHFLERGGHGTAFSSALSAWAEGSDKPLIILMDEIDSLVESLLAQHTDETGQKFSSEAVSCIWHLSQGQPWLVNALAYETCFKMKENRDRSVPISKEMVDQAEENLISRRETHLDQLGRIQRKGIHTYGL